MDNSSDLSYDLIQQEPDQQISFLQSKLENLHDSIDHLENLIFQNRNSPMKKKNNKDNNTFQFLQPQTQTIVFELDQNDTSQLNTLLNQDLQNFTFEELELHDEKDQLVQYKDQLYEQTLQLKNAQEEQVEITHQMDENLENLIRLYQQKSKKKQELIEEIQELQMQQEKTFKNAQKKIDQKQEKKSQRLTIKKEINEQKLQELKYKKQQLLQQRDRESQKLSQYRKSLKENIDFQNRVTEKINQQQRTNLQNLIKINEIRKKMGLIELSQVSDEDKCTQNHYQIQFQSNGTIQILQKEPKKESVKIQESSIIIKSSISNQSKKKSKDRDSCNCQIY